MANSAPRRLAFLYEPGQRDRARVRYEPLLSPLLESGRDVGLFPVPKSWPGRRRLAAAIAARPTVLVLPARLYNRFALARFRAAAERLILDLDDPIYLRPADIAHKGPSATRARRWARSLARIDACACANPHLLDKVARDAPGLPRALIPNPIAPIALPQRQDPRPRLLWIGSRATLPFLTDALPALARARPCPILRIIADAFPKAPQTIAMERVPWSLEAERQGLADADIGLMPLGSDAWSRGKSGYKLLQYMNAGLPAIASPQGGGAFLLPEGYPYLAQAPEEWAASVEALRDDEAERQRWGARLRDEVERRFRPPRIAELWAALAG